MNIIDSCIKSKYMKVKDRPLQRKAEVAMRFLFLDAQTLNAKERHFILPRVLATFIMQSVAFISSPSQDHTKLIFPLNKRSYRIIGNFYCLCTDDNLLEGSYSIHR